MKKLNYEEVKQYFEKQGCELLECNYKNAKEKMNYRCVCGGISYINYSNFKSGKRCLECMKDKLSRQRRKKQEIVVDIFEQQGCVLLDVYKNAQTTMFYRCQCGRKAYISLANLSKGKYCKKCGLKKISGHNHYNWEQDRQKVADNLSIRKRCCNMLQNSLKMTGRKKNTLTRNLLGYTGKQLQDHIRSHPNWHVIKDKDWDIDHIFPLKAFLDYQIHNTLLINCLDNLEPVLRTINRRKNKIYNKKEFETWLTSKKFNYEPLADKSEVK